MPLHAPAIRDRLHALRAVAKFHAYEIFDADNYNQVLPGFAALRCYARLSPLRAKAWTTLTPSLRQ